MPNKYIQSKTELAENMRFIRECSGFTQQEIAEQLSVDRSTYAYYEAGKTEPSLQNLLKLCEFYNLEITDLITKGGVQHARLGMTGS